MSYDEPIYMSFSTGQHDFTTARKWAVKGPKGKRARVIDTLVSATTTFTADTTEGRVRVGTADDADKYVDLGLGTLAAESALTATETADAIKDEDIDTDEEVIIEVVPPTGGTPAGAGIVHLVLGWF